MGQARSGTRPAEIHNYGVIKAIVSPKTIPMAFSTTSRYSHNMVVPKLQYQTELHRQCESQCTYCKSGRNLQATNRGYTAFL